MILLILYIELKIDDIFEIFEFLEQKIENIL